MTDLDRLTFFTALLVITALLAGLFWPLGGARAQDSFKIGERSRPELCRGWINTQCSCSHRACWEPKAGEFESLNDGRWRETSSGQVKEQTGWSRDGSFVACAWTPGKVPGVQYHVGKGAPLSCLFPPMPAF